MKGTDAKTGRELTGLEHLKQSIVDILTTPIGSRIMRRDYGSKLFELIDQPTNRNLDIYVAVAEALAKWEKRFKLDKVKITEVNKGKITLSLEGSYLPEKKNVSFDNINL